MSLLHQTVTRLRVLAILLGKCHRQANRLRGGLVPSTFQRSGAEPSARAAMKQSSYSISLCWVGNKTFPDWLGGNQRTAPWRARKWMCVVRWSRALPKPPSQKARLIGVCLRAIDPLDTRQRLQAVQLYGTSDVLACWKLFERVAFSSWRG